MIDSQKTVSSYDVVLHGDRVIDPESATDAIRDVGINGGTIAAISPTPLVGRRVLNVENQVVAPGFIDMHSHCFGIAGLRLQALDGITTALELELAVARQTNSGNLVFVEFLQEDDPSTRELLTRALVFPDTAIATDGFEPQWHISAYDEHRWPLPADAVTHPRTAGTFSRAIRTLWRQTGALSLMEVIRCSARPSKIQCFRIQCFRSVSGSASAAPRTISAT